MQDLRLGKDKIKFAKNNVCKALENNVCNIVKIIKNPYKGKIIF